MSILFNEKKINSPPKYKSYSHVNELSNSILNNNNKTVNNSKKTKHHTIYLSIFAHGGIETNTSGLNYLESGRPINNKPIDFFFKELKIPSGIKIFNKVTLGKFGYENFGDDDAGLDYRNKYIYKYIKRILSRNYFDENLKKGIKDFKLLCYHAIKNSKAQSDEYILRYRILYETGQLKKDKLTADQIKRVKFLFFLLDLNCYLYNYWYDANNDNTCNKVLISKKFSYSNEEISKDFGVYVSYASGGILKNANRIHINSLFKDGKYSFTLEELLKKLLSYGYDKIYLMDLSCNLPNKKLRKHEEIKDFHMLYDKYIF